MINHTYHRRSIRLKGYDYSQSGAYFITILTYQRMELFGQIEYGQAKLNQFGQIVLQTIDQLQTLYPYLNIDPHIVMPNHFHGIFRITELEDECKGGSRPALTENIKKKPLGQLIGAFKTISAKHINLFRNAPGLPVWHRNYYEHIIRNQAEYRKIWDYINTNPQNWEQDSLRTSESE
jgi:putative transposase